MVSRLPLRPCWLPISAPACPPDASPSWQRACCNWMVRCAYGRHSSGSRSVKIFWAQVLLVQQKRRTCSRRETGRPPDGRSCSLRVYRLCTRVERVPQLGHAAVEDVVRSVSVISLATCTCSMRTSGRSGKMMIACNGYLEEREKGEKCSTSQYITF